MPLKDAFVLTEPERRGRAAHRPACRAGPHGRQRGQPAGGRRRRRLAWPGAFTVASAGRNE